MPTLELSLSESTYQALQQQAATYNQSAETLSALLVNLFVELDTPTKISFPPTPSAKQASRQAKIRAEAQAWRTMPKAVRQRYQGQIVAVHQGQVIDSDPDRLTLYRRVHQKWGHIPILMTPADAVTTREFSIRGPSLRRETA